MAKSYEISKRLPAAEIYVLRAQIQRSAVSVPANIAEGHARHHLGDYLHHLSMANGSLKELKTHILIAGRLAFLNDDEVESLVAMSDELGRMLHGLMRELRKSAT